jgi:hypothetical protein
MDVDEFATVFRDGGVRSWLDWEVALRGRFPVDETFSRSVDLLGSLQTVWYLRDDGGFGDWRQPTHQRQSVAEAAGLSDFPSARSRAYINELAAGYAAAADPPVLVLPAYRTADGRPILLDGNHRAVAAYRGARAPRLLVYCLIGPADPLVFPDLLHEVGAKSEADWAAMVERIHDRFLRPAG